MPIKAVVFDAYGTLFDVQSVAGVTEDAFPGHGETITQIWRLKQLEYTWLRALMGRYEDFWSVTQASLDFTLKTLGLAATPDLLARIAAAYDALALYPEALTALQGLTPTRLAIFSNGSPAMLTNLTNQAGIDGLLETVISVDEIRSYKPDPRGYRLVEERLGLTRDEILFVSSNGFDIAGAKAYGMTVARIERVTLQALRDELSGAAVIGPKSLFKALRMQEEQLGAGADLTIAALTELVPYVAARRWSPSIQESNDDPLYYHPSPNPAKVALFLEEAGLPYEMVPVDTRKGDQFKPDFLAINPNGKTPALTDGDVKIFDSNAILLYLAEKTGQFLPPDTAEMRGQMLSWLMFVATGIGPYTGQTVHFSRFAPEKVPYAINRYAREAERHWGLLDDQLGKHRYMLGDDYTLIDMAVWGWATRAQFALGDEAFGKLTNVRRHLDEISARPAAQRAVALKDQFAWKTEIDDEARKILFPSNAFLKS